MSKTWRLEQARRRYQNTMDICDVDLAAVLGPLDATPYAMIIPAFAFEPGPLTQWSLAQVEGYRRIIPWNILSLYKYSDFAEADISLFIALSDSVYPHFEETLSACNFPAERILKFQQHPTIRAWHNKLIPMFDLANGISPALQGEYPLGILHADASALVMPSKQGEKLQTWKKLAEEWNVTTQEFVLHLPPLMNRASCGSTLLAGIKRMNTELGKTTDSIWAGLSRISGIPVKTIKQDWEEMWKKDRYYDMLGMTFGISRKRLIDKEFRQHITELCALLEVDEGAFGFYFYERQLTAEQVYTHEIIGGLERYRDIYTLSNPCYMWGIPGTLDWEDKQIWEHYYRSLRHDAPLHKP